MGLKWYIPHGAVANTDELNDLPKVIQPPVDQGMRLAFSDPSAVFHPYAKPFKC